MQSSDPGQKVLFALFPKKIQTPQIPFVTANNHNLQKRFSQVQYHSLFQHGNIRTKHSVVSGKKNT
jgi:hypothetical protein